MFGPRTRLILRNLGPGILYAAAAIGVSHLVQSTRAGADLGLWMIGIVVLANVLKFPFFEFGPRYAASTGEDLIQGYRRLGWWAIGVFLLMTFGTIFIIQAAVTVVTAGLAAQISGIELHPAIWSAIILGLCVLILLIGRYSFLDRFIKFIMLILALTTVLAVLMAFFAEIPRDPEKMGSLKLGNRAHIFFLVALIGWMPAPFDISVWHSVWSIAKKKEYEESGMREAMMDFRIGYWGTALLAICFVSLGALIVHGTGQEMPEKGTAFAGELIRLYTQSLGGWSYPVIALAALTTMFSTTLTVLDAYPRVLSPTMAKVTGLYHEKHRGGYLFWLAFTVIGALTVLFFHLSSMTAMVDLATTLSFILAPLFCVMNYRVILGRNVPQEAKPGLITHLVAWAGMLLSFGLALYYLYLQYLS